jgi:hypothetical protein
LEAMSNNSNSKTGTTAVGTIFISLYLHFDMYYSYYFTTYPLMSS